MIFSRDGWITVVILGLLMMGALLRSSFYGNLNLSIGNPDTQSYIDSSKAPLLSNEIFTGRRLFTTNLLYKLANDSQKCPLEAVSFPAEGRERVRKIQPCFNTIVLLQNLLSIFAWCLLAWTTARWLQSPLYKFLAVFLILAFGFTPQIAEWDSVLSPESLSNSLFVIVIALLQEIIPSFDHQGSNVLRFHIRLLVPLWFTVFAFWVFIRDVHVYALLILAVLVLPLLFMQRLRTSLYVPTILVLSLGLFALGNSTAKNSTRWQPSIDHVLTDYIHPYPARVVFFVERGMPGEHPSKEYDIWFQDKAMSSYGRFLIFHPGFVVSTIFAGSYFKSGFVQPYFPAPEVKFRETLLILGEILHPTTYAIYLIDVLLLLSICYVAWKSREHRIYGMAWLALWMFLYLFVSLLLSFFGDTNGTGRHIYPSVEGLRLFAWIYLLVIMDIASNNRARARFASIPA